MTAPIIQQVTDREILWINTQLESARSFVTRYAAPPADCDLGVETLDAAWKAWISTAPTDTAEINQAINCIGISFGSLLVRTGEFAWCIASDDWGTDLAVRALPDRGNVLVYPADFVSKRWESRTTDFLTDALSQIIEHVSRTRQDWDAARPSI